MNNTNFIQKVQTYYHENYRHMPWRDITDPYYVLVSELMLQQTQVSRVIPKFEQFIRLFPTIQVLAGASQADVLEQWNGLGYNRRARFLHEAARQIESQFGGKIPPNYEDLILLKGVGPNTANAILAYAFNMPVVFIETNIRSVYIHEFFPNREKVTDAEIIALVQATLDHDNPREWYWALMDYGAYIKKLHKNPSRRSKHHTKQSPFEGSERQLRGQVLKILIAHRTINTTMLREKIGYDARLDKIVEALIQEGFIARKNNQLKIAE